MSYSLLRIKYRINNMRKNSFLLLLAAFMVGCNHGTDSTETLVGSPVVVMGDTLTVAPGSTIAPRLEVSTVGDSAFSATLTTTGVVMAIPSAYAEVAAPFSGRVVRSLVRMGQTVRAGTPLFEISSSDYAEVVKNYIQTKSEMDMAKRALDRTQDLHDNKVASAKELDETKTAYGLALEEYRHAVAVAKEYQIDLKTAEVGQPMVVRSPIGGRVLSNSLVIGEYLKEDADAKVVVADLDKVWVSANVSEMDAPFVDGIKDVEVSLVARPDSTVRGHVAYVGGILDPETRTVQTIIECSNPRHLMLPNMYAKVRMRVQNCNSIVVPKEAVLQGEQSRYVLRKVGEGRYVRTAVEVQSIDEHHLRVTKGLSVGDEIIVRGAIYLN